MELENNINVDYPYNIILNIVNDADWLDSLGDHGIKRCIQYSEKIGRNVQEMIRYYEYKIIKLPNYIKTKTAKEMLIPLYEWSYNWYLENKYS